MVSALSLGRNSGRLSSSSCYYYFYYLTSSALSLRGNSGRLFSCFCYLLLVVVFLVLHEFGITARGEIGTPYLGKAAAAARAAPAFGTVNVLADTPDCLVTVPHN